MPIDVVGPTRDATFTQTRWPKLLACALEHGWCPVGTHLKRSAVAFLSGLPRHHPEVGRAVREWDGRYDSNNGQTVICADAANLGVALVRAQAGMSPGLRASAQELIEVCRGGAFDVF
jgi:hypothetical protein